MDTQDLVVAAETTYGLTSGRLVATVAALLGVAAVVVGVRARSRARRHGGGRSGALFAAGGGVVATVAGVAALSALGS